MAAVRKLDDLQILLAVCLVEPGELRDVFEGLSKFILPSGSYYLRYNDVKSALHKLIDENFIEYYAGRRYILSENGKKYISETGMRHKIDARRMFLLRNTRRARW